MDFLQKRIREKLIQRGNSERQRAEEWERSLKPTTYLGKNLYQELGGTPIEGRYLGQQGLIPGQSVPNIGRNPNKPVIPGLPAEPTPTQEEGGVIEKSGQAYSAIFTREVAGGRTQWTDLEMMQRDPAKGFNATPTTWGWTNGFSSNDARGFINGIVNDHTFYYWNGKTIQELYTHTTSTLLASGSATYGRIGVYDLIELADLPYPGVIEAGTPTNNFDFNYQVNAEYVLITKASSYPYAYYPALTYRPDGTSYSFTFLSWEINGSIYAIGRIPYTDQMVFDATAWKIGVLVYATSAGSLDWELYRVNLNSNYFTFTQNGTAFASITAGEEGDGNVRIRYFSATGLQPATLTQTDLTQDNIDDPEFVLPYADFDWRSPRLTSSDPLVDSDAQGFTFGVGDWACQVRKMPGEGYVYRVDNSDGVPFVKYCFNGEGTSQSIDLAGTYTATEFDPVTGSVIPPDLQNEDVTGIKWPRINSSSLGEEGVDWYIEDICVPTLFNRNYVKGSYFWFPMLGIIPSLKKIYF